MATSTTGVTPRLRMTRHSPTQDRNITTSFSEAGPSRLPEFSQLVNLTMKDMDISDNNIYASDVPTESTPQALPQITTKPESPAAVLRALLSRLPNKEGTPTHHPDRDTEHRYPSDRESDYDVETASATTSVAQSSLKNIFSRALREPGGTPRKDRSHRRRSNSIGDTDIENTPHVLEAQDIKGKRRSLSDDEVDNGNKTSARPRTRLRKPPQPLTQEFLRERFGKFPNSPINHQVATRDESFNPHLNSSQISPPMATSTPQRSLMSFNQSRFNSNLLDKDSEMQNAFNALDSSMDNLSDRSISPIPTLRVESEPVEDMTQTKLNGITDSKIHTREASPQPSLQATSWFNDRDLSSDIPSTVKASRSKSTVYKHDSLGEQTMSLSLPMGHIKLQADVDHSRLPNGSLSRQHSIASLRPSSPLPDHHRPHTPIDAVHERERNWNKPQQVQRKGSSSHLSHRSSTPSIRGSESPVDMQEREDNWDTPRTDSLHTLNRDSSHVDGHLHPHRTPPKLARNPPSRPLSPLPPASLTRVSSVGTDGDSRSHPQPITPFPSSPSNGPDFSSVTRNGTRRHPVTPAAKLSSSIAKHALREQTNELLESEGEDLSSRGKVATPYTWPVIGSGHQHAQPTPSSNGRIPGHHSEADDVRETDYSSSVDSPKSRPIESPEVSDEQHQAFEKLVIPNGDSTYHDNPSPPAVQAALTATPPHRVNPKNVNLEFMTPSQPKTLPDLPTPSSSDESIDGSLTKMAKIQKLGTAHQNKWLQTPKPPGGWLATPQPAKTAENTVLDEPETPVANGKVPGTPAESFATRTPKPPGGWTIPAPSSLEPGESNYPEDKGQRSQLLTPVNSLSRGSALNSKTPGVPGGWVNTPASRKSVLKVHFDPQRPEVKEESGLYVHNSAPESRGEDSNPSELDSPSDAQNELLHLPRSPRRAKANIRVLDAFGREESPSSSPKKNGNTSRIRVLDAMGRDIEEEQFEKLDKMEETLTRDELLSRLRQGLNELVDDIDVDNEEDVFTSDRSRIEELVATSKQARGVREKLFSQSQENRIQPPVVKPSYVSFSWKRWLGWVFLQALIICLVYRISVFHSRNFFLNAYYDPFNPERHLSSGTIHIPRFHPSLVLRDGGAWTWIDYIDIAAYLSTLLPMDVVHNNAWTPT